MAHIKEARAALQKAKARGHGHGLFRIANQHLDMTVWLIAHGRELRNVLKPKDKMHWSNPAWKLPHTVQKYEPRDAELGSVLKQIGQAHSELRQSPFNGLTYGYFGLAFESMDMAADAVRTGALLVESGACNANVAAHPASPAPPAAVPAVAPATAPAAVPAAHTPPAPSPAQAAPAK